MNRYSPLLYGSQGRIARADIVLDNQSAAATPSSGQLAIWADTQSKLLQTKNDAGLVHTLSDIDNASTANQTGFAADTYMNGSNVSIPSTLVRVGTKYYFAFDMVKTGAGTAAPVVTVRFGTAGTTADTARLTFSFAVGTAAIDTGLVEVFAHFRVSGASATMAGMCRITHHLAATGLTTTGASGTAIILATAAAFDATVASSIIGVSFNGGASFSGTNTVQQALLSNC